MSPDPTPGTLERLPPQPPANRWAFIRELRASPVHPRTRWTPRRPRRGEAFFPGGIRLDFRFQDPRGVLAKARADFLAFLKSVGLTHGGSFPLVVRERAGLLPEEHRVRVTSTRCELEAGDTEGVRRGLTWIEDEMLRRGGPFLSLGETTRTSRIRTRISRCFYGPINRPPRNRDELADEVDYYPDGYLNRLAHEGVNALWITVDLFRTVPSRIIPEYGRHSGPRLEKLRRTVRKCARHGIRIYPFCIEPAAFDRPAPEVAAAAVAHPELVGHQRAFCTSTALGRAYLEEATRTLFSEVPGLGGLIVIPVGERRTHCYSAGPEAPGCPRCSRRARTEVLADTLEAMASGMRAVDPKAELVAWPYGQTVCWGRDATIEAAGHVPEGVALQHNFETAGWNRQLGRRWPTWDYWLSYVGPSETFRRCARRAAGKGTRVFAKLQVGCSHEVCTTQHVPVPGLLYRKYRAMRELGVSGAMHSWYFGNHPSMMTRAAGELSFDPFPRREADFLKSLAGRDWGRHASRVVAAWRHFARGYSHYPTAHLFGYYGPMHDGPVWPIHLVPRRRPLAPTWLLGYPPSGDHIADCVANGFTLEEIALLCRRMAREWNRGTRLLRGLRTTFRANPDRLRDLRVAEALGLQFQSGSHLLDFYLLRERLAEARRVPRRLDLLRSMERLVHGELAIDRKLLPLARMDSTLGFHSEAEGYKYFPDLIRWRMRQLRRLLRTEFPTVLRRARLDAPLFPEYTGERASGAVYRARLLRRLPLTVGGPAADTWDDLPTARCVHWFRQVPSPERQAKCPHDWADHLPAKPPDPRDHTVSWQACHDRRALALRVTCRSGTPHRRAFEGEELQVQIEPRRTLPRLVFHLRPFGDARLLRDDGYVPFHDPRWEARGFVRDGEWSVILRIPFGCLGTPHRPRRLRINLLHVVPLVGSKGTLLGSWVPLRPVQGRLAWGFLNPATDFGWLELDGSRA